MNLHADGDNGEYDGGGCGGGGGDDDDVDDYIDVINEFCWLRWQL